MDMERKEYIVIRRKNGLKWMVGTIGFVRFQHSKNLANCIK